MEIPNVSRSGTIDVLKRNGSSEPFDVRKLRGCLLRVLTGTPDDYHVADALANGISHYIRRRRMRALSSAAILEMALTVLQGVGFPEAGNDLEDHYVERRAWRERLTVHHDGDTRTVWSKQWLVRLALARWDLTDPTARIIAGQVERDLWERNVSDVARDEVLHMLARHLAAYGLTWPEAPAPAAQEA